MSNTDIYSLLKHDHQEVAALFLQIMDSSAPTVRKDLLARVEQELRLHTEAEESTFYAALSEREPLRGQIAEARQDHHRVSELLNRLGSLGPNDERWEEIFMQLKENVQTHVQQEENEMFPKAQQMLSGQEAETLGQRFQAEKQQLKK